MAKGGKFDFNNAQSFAALTQSTAAAILNHFELDDKEWLITEGTYTAGSKGSVPVRFHVFQGPDPAYQAELPNVDDKGGRRVNILQFAYVDGQATDDMGRKGDTFELDILLHGIPYKVAMNNLMVALNDPVPGILNHPVRGEIRCKMLDYSMHHSHEVFSGVMLRLTMVEHSFAAAGFTQQTAIKTKLSAALQALNAINNAINTVRAAINLATSLRTAIITRIQQWQQFFTGFLVDANSTFNAGSTIDIPGAVPTTAGGTAAAINATGRVVGATTLTSGIGSTSFLPGGYIKLGGAFASAIPSGDPLANVPVELLSDTAKAAIATLVLTQRNDALRAQANDIIQTIVDGGVDLLFGDVILEIERAAILAQGVLEQGLQSSRAKLLRYTVPINRVMTIREVAFANGLTPDQAPEIELLNPELLSVNLIPAGTVVVVPVDE